MLSFYSTDVFLKGMQCNEKSLEILHWKISWKENYTALTVCFSGVLCLLCESKERVVNKEILGLFGN